MSLFLVVAAAVCGLVLAALGVGLMAAWQVRILSADSRKSRERQRAEMEAIGHRLEALAARIEDARVAPHTQSISLERGGLNLSRRSHALRLHRRGEAAAQIASELAVPVQEIELLIKVHEIVMSTV